MHSRLSQLTVRTRIAGVPFIGLLVMASAGVHGQTSVPDASPKPLLSIVPRVSVTETMTDNVHLSSVSQQSEQITEISPGIRINKETGRLKAYFDYSLTEILYAQNSSASRSQNSLNTFGSIEAVDNWFFIDFSGSISQQAISAFGTLSSGNTSINANQTEVSNYRVSPYVRGRLGDLASYEARYSRAVTLSDGLAGSSVSTTDGFVRVSGDSSFKDLGWSADVSKKNIDYRTGRPTESDRLNMGLSYLITPQLRVFANAGQESNNYTSIDKQSNGTSGVGVSWSPSEKTKISASQEHRSFGESHSFIFEHKTARTTWRLSDSKDISVTPGQSDLLLNNVTPNPSVISGFLTSAVSLQRRQDLAVSLLGVRDTLTFIVTRSESSRLDTMSPAIDDLSTSLIHQRGISINLSHRLTPDYSLLVLVSQQNTSGSLSLQDTSLHTFNINVTGKVGRKATASVGLRRVVYSSSISPYGETAVIINLNAPF